MGFLYDNVERIKFSIDCVIMRALRNIYLNFDDLVIAQ